MGGLHGSCLGLTASGEGNIDDHTERIQTVASIPGTTDDYHCTLVNPHVARNEYIVSSEFVAGSNEVHHAALFLLSPSLAATAERGQQRRARMDVLRAAASELGPGRSSPAVPLLTFWTPGAGVDDFPKGTGVPLPAGSLVVMQVHYTLLLGDKAVKNSLVLRTRARNDAAPSARPQPDARTSRHPMPHQRERSVVLRRASLANLGHRFGSTAPPR